MDGLCENVLDSGMKLCHKKVTLIKIKEHEVLVMRRKHPAAVTNC